MSGIGESSGEFEYRGIQDFRAYVHNYGISRALQEDVFLTHLNFVDFAFDAAEKLMELCIGKDLGEQTSPKKLELMK